jgi:hypothetical protein
VVLKNQLRAPAQFVRDWAKGYLTIAKVSNSVNRLIHFTPAEPYASPICGINLNRSGTYDVGILDPYTYNVCGKCIEIAIAKRKEHSEKPDSRL